MTTRHDTRQCGGQTSARKCRTESRPDLEADTARSRRGRRTRHDDRRPRSTSLVVDRRTSRGVPRQSVQLHASRLEDELAALSRLGSRYSEEAGEGWSGWRRGLFGFAQDRCSRCAQKTTRPFSKDQRIPHTSWAAGLAPSCHMCATRIAARASRVSQPSPARRRSRSAATLPARASLTSTMHSRARCHAASPPRRLALLTSLGALLLLLLVLALMEPTHRLRLELVAAVRPVLVLVI